MFCEQCGNPIPEGAAFCRQCGSQVKPDSSKAPGITQKQSTGSLVGWSQVINHPEIHQAAQKNKKSAMGCMWFFTILFPVGFLLAGLLIEEMPLNEAIIIGVGLGLLMLIINLIRIRGMKRPIWEGVVIDKYTKQRSKQSRDDSSSVTYYTEYNVVIKGVDGKKKYSVERDLNPMYGYLSIGDRVRFHPMFDSYEKFENSKDKIIYCNICHMMNPIANERCERCSNLLFK